MCLQTMCFSTVGLARLLMQGSLILTIPLNLLPGRLLEVKGTRQGELS